MDLIGSPSPGHKIRKHDRLFQWSGEILFMKDEPGLFRLGFEQGYDISEHDEFGCDFSAIRSHSFGASKSVPLRCEAAYLCVDEQALRRLA